MEEHKFWKTQPIITLSNEQNIEAGPIELVDPNNIKQDPYGLPDGFEWYTLDLNNENDMNDLCNFLQANYLEDTESVFHFAYSKESIKWIAQCPNHFPELFISVRLTSNKKIVATIFGIPCDIKVYDKIIKQVEINLLCVTKKLRSKRLAPVLIKEITRRINLKGIFQATYTAGMLLPTPITTCTYFHRSLNFKKLVDIGFCGLRDNETIEKMTKANRLPKVIFNCNVRIL